MKKNIKKENIESVDKKNKEKVPDVISPILNTMKYIVKRLSTDKSNPDIRIESKQIILTSKKCPKSNKPVVEIGYDIQNQKLTLKSSVNFGIDDKVSLSKIVPFFNGSKCKTSTKKDVMEMIFEIEKPHKESSRKKITEIINSMNDLFIDSVPRKSKIPKKSNVDVVSEQ